MAKKEFQNKTVLITGSSQGIGYEFARIFAANKNNLILVARNPKRLKQIKDELTKEFGIEIKTYAKDLFLSNAPLEIYNQLKEEDVYVDILINNAGCATYGEFSDVSWDNHQNTVQLNVMALIFMTKLFLPGMIEKKQGWILNIASDAASFPTPLMSVYSATKAFVVSFSLALAFEAEKSGVTITTLCPGVTRTNFHISAGMENSLLINRKKHVAPYKVAYLGYKSLLKEKKIVVYGLMNKFNIFISKFISKSLILKIGYNKMKSESEENV